MNQYILPHDLSGERGRLTLMAELLDPFHQRKIEALGLQPGWRCLEVGCGIGSISGWLAEQVGASGQVTASDIDINYLRDLKVTNLEVRRLDILHDPIEEGSYDLVTARALLHHLPTPDLAVARMVRALKPGGALLLIEPDMLPATVAEPEPVRAFWSGWFKWAESQGIDYWVGRKMAAMMSHAGCRSVSGEGFTAYYSGQSAWADYWMATVQELKHRLLETGAITQDLLAAFERQYSDPTSWTSSITFVATSGRRGE